MELFYRNWEEYEKEQKDMKEKFDKNQKLIQELIKEAFE